MSNIYFIVDSVRDLIKIDPMKEKFINFAKYTPPHTICISGRQKGEALRKELKLDKEDQSSDVVQISVPLHIISLGCTFLLGCFGESVRRLGRDKFYEKYKFNGHHLIKDDVDSAVYFALKTSNPLPKV